MYYVFGSLKINFFIERLNRGIKLILVVKNCFYISSFICFVGNSSFFFIRFGLNRLLFLLINTCLFVL